MALLIDTSGANAQLSGEEFTLWARKQTAFLSSVMGEFAGERRALAEALEAVGFRVRWFEEFGGRDDDAEQAYISEVRASTIYLGLLGDQYGGLLPSGEYKGYSATHAEFEAARAAGKRITFWARRPDDQREGPANKFLNAVGVFHVYGNFTDSSDLVPRVLRRLREIATEDEAPWVKLGDMLFRATRITGTRDRVIIEARIYERRVMRALESAAGHGDSYSRGDELPLTFLEASGRGRITGMTHSATSGALTDVTLELDFAPARIDSMRMSINSMSSDDIVEANLRAGLFGEPLPERLGSWGYGSDVTDPWAELLVAGVPSDTVPALAKLLLVEHLVGGGQVGTIEEFRLGPAHGGTRPLELTYLEPKQYVDQQPGRRSISGKRRWT